MCRTEQETGWNRTDQVTGQKAAVMYSEQGEGSRTLLCQACSSALWTVFPLADTAVSHSFKVGSPQSGFANVYLILVPWMFVEVDYHFFLLFLNVVNSLSCIHIFDIWFTVFIVKVFNIFLI